MFQTLLLSEKLMIGQVYLAGSVMYHMNHSKLGPAETEKRMKIPTEVSVRSQ